MGAGFRKKTIETFLALCLTHTQSSPLQLKAWVL